MDARVRPSYIRWFQDLRLTDLALVGGKNASLGELIGTLGPSGIRVPGGFAITAEAYRDLLDQNRLRSRIGALLTDANRAWHRRCTFNAPP